MIVGIKKIIFVFGMIHFLWSFSIPAQPLQFDVKGEAAILMNAQTGAILLERNAYTSQFPASTTKVGTALYVLKHHPDELNISIEADQEALAPISPEAKRKSNYQLPAHLLETDGTHIGIKKGEIFTLHDLMRGLLICSANDAANVIAKTLGPSIPVFMEKLNTYLKGIGCEHTHFCNPHGLHHPQHVTTAYDLALIMREALKYPIFCDIVSQPRFMRPKTNKQAAVTLLQGNRLIRAGKFYYSKAIGGKTGYHAKSKNTFVGAARGADDRTLILVLLGYPNRSLMFEEAIKIFDLAFNQPKIQRVFLKAGPQKFQMELPKANRPVHTYLADALSLDYYPAEDPQAKCFLYWLPLSLPISKGQQVGEMRLISSEGNVLKSAPLLASEDIELTWPHHWMKSTPSFSWLLILGAGLSGIAFLNAIWKRLRSN